MFAVDAVHLRYLFNRQGCRLHLRLLKSHELGTESCSFIVGKLEIVAEDFVGLLVPPLVLAHVKKHWPSTHRIVHIEQWRKL